MPRRLPSLNALRAFEAAARQLSFTKAAEELHVTQAAISHQVKALEEQLGLQLFRRLNRRLLLTDPGQAYLSTLTAVFDEIDEATERLAAAHSGGSLRVSVLPSMAARWLLPRLSRFRERHPDIDVLVSAAHTLADFRRDDMDLAIRYGKGVYPGLEAVFMMRDEMERLETEKTELAEHRRALEAQISQMDRASEYVERAEALASRLSKGLDKMVFSERRELLRLLVDEVVYDQSEVLIKTIIPLEPLHPAPREGTRVRSKRITEQSAIAF